MSTTGKVILNCLPVCRDTCIRNNRAPGNFTGHLQLIVVMSWAGTARELLLFSLHILCMPFKLPVSLLLSLQVSWSC